MKHLPHALACATWCLAGLASAAEFDPFNTRATVSSTPSHILSATPENRDPCQLGDMSTALDVLAVVERALCNHPQTRQAWANVKTQAAQVGLSQAAYLPTANMTLNVSKGNNTTQVTRYPELSYDVQNTARDQALSISWTIFDFGLRRANLNNARYLLAAANATQDAQLQTVFAGASQAFYDLLSNQSALSASQDAEKAAHESFMAAAGKHAAGAGALADKLQAQTNYAQATLNRVKAEGASNNAHGTLAIAMGLQANTPFNIDAGQALLPDTSFVHAIDTLIEEAKRDHPGLLAAKAQAAAAQESIKAARAEGMPSLKFVGNVDHNDQIGQAPAGTNQTPSNNYTLNKSIGIQLTIPLFDGVNRSYRVQAATAQAALKMADVTQTEHQITLDVWTNYQSLSTETENLTATAELLQSAAQSMQVAQGRYKAGVGTIIELLNAQSALASGQQQRIQALSNWRIARLKLAASLGKLGVWAIR